MQIPYRWSAGDASLASQVVLYVQTQREPEWREVSRAQPTVQYFNYSAVGDGEYRFAVRTIDRDGRQNPPGELQAEIWVVVDTSPPRLSPITASLDASGVLRAEFDVTEERLDSAAIVVQAQDPTSGQWKDLPVQSTPSGVGLVHVRASGSLPPSAGRAVRLRASVRDQAGNVQEAGQEVSAGGGSSFSFGAFSAPSSAGPALTPPTNRDPFLNTTPDLVRQSQPAPQTFTNTNMSPQASAGGVSNPFAAPALTAPPTSPAPPVNGWASAGTQQSPPTQTPPSFANQPWPADTASVSASPFHTAATTIPAPQPTPSTPFQPASTSIATPSVPTAATQQLLNGRRFDLDYNLENVGKWGVSKVELWGTRDGGRSWQLFAKDHDNQSPVQVTVPGEGDYGFRILVSSIGGFTATEPQPGDQPEITVRVDLTQPSLMFGDIQQGQGYAADQLTIAYQASDNNFGPTPLALYYSDAPDGVWIPIASSIPNEGRYVFKLQRHLPSQLFLKAEARDLAGNVSQVVTPSPIIAVLPQPSGRIGGIRALETATAPAFGAPPIPAR